MKIGVPRETFADERRVATTPTVAAELIKLGYDVVVEKKAGEAANFADDAYREVGCEMARSAKALYDATDIVLKVRAPNPTEVKKLRAGQTLISFSGRLRTTRC